MYGQKKYNKVVSRNARLKFILKRRTQIKESRSKETPAMRKIFKDETKDPFHFDSSSFYNVSTRSPPLWFTRLWGGWSALFQIGLKLPAAPAAGSPLHSKPRQRELSFAATSWLRRNNSLLQFKAPKQAF